MDSFDSLFSDKDTVESLFDEPQERRRGEAFVEGAADIAGGGFVDELTGVAAGVLSTAPAKWLREKTGILPPNQDGTDPLRPTGGGFGEAYTGGRDSKREDVAAIREAEPGYFRAGQASAALASIAAPSVTASKWGQAGITVGEGALRGVGSSEADLTKGDVGGVVRDAATGAVIGTAAAGLGVAGQALAKAAGPAAKPTFQEAAREALAASGKYPGLVKPAAEVVKKESGKLAEVARAGRDIAIGYGVDELVSAAGKEGLPLGTVLGALSAARRVSKGGTGFGAAAQILKAAKGKKVTADVIKTVMGSMPAAAARVFAQELTGGSETSSPETMQGLFE